MTPKPKKTEEVKARVDVGTKEALITLANHRQMDLSDILREAVRYYLKGNSSHANAST